MQPMTLPVLLVAVAALEQEIAEPVQVYLPKLPETNKTVMVPVVEVTESFLMLPKFLLLVR